MHCFFGNFVKQSLNMRAPSLLRSESKEAVEKRLSIDSFRSGCIYCAQHEIDSIRSSACVLKCVTGFAPQSFDILGSGQRHLHLNTTDIV